MQNVREVPFPDHIPPRQECCVPGCNKSWPYRPENFGCDLICRQHLKMSPPSLLRRWKAVKRAYAGQRRRMPQNRDYSRITRMEKLLDKFWERIIANATPGEKPAGMEAILDEMGVRG